MPDEARPRTTSPSAIRSGGQHGAPLDRAHGEASKVESPDRKVPAFRRSRRRSVRNPPRQPSPMPATTSPATPGIQRAGGKVVEEEQWLRALDHEIVDAHGDKVDSDTVIAPASAASRTLVPTPSVVATRTGSAKPQAARSNRPPNPPSARHWRLGARSRSRPADPVDKLRTRVDVDVGLGVTTPAGCR